MHVLLILLVAVATGSVVASIGWLEAIGNGISRGRAPHTPKQQVLRMSQQVASKIVPWARELGQAVMRLWGVTMRAASSAALRTATGARVAGLAVAAGVTRLRVAHHERVEARRAREAAAPPRERVRFDRAFLLTAEFAPWDDTGDVRASAFRLDAVDDRHPLRGAIGLILVIALVGAILALALGGTAWGFYHLLNART